MTPAGEAVLEAAQRVCAAEGTQALSMRRVAAELGVSATALYRHFPGKDDLLDAIAGKGFRSLEQELRSTARGHGTARLARLADAALTFALRHPELWGLMFERTRRGARVFPRDFRGGASPSGQVFLEAIEEGMREGRLRRDDPLEVGLSLWAQIQGLISLHRAGRIEGPEPALRKRFRSCVARLLRGLRAP